MDPGAAALRAEADTFPQINRILVTDNLDRGYRKGKTDIVRKTSAMTTTSAITPARRPKVGRIYPKAFIPEYFTCKLFRIKILRSRWHIRFCKSKRMNILRRSE
jgi:hypothetical protein